eukprot:TRINITY_DN5932_c0_g1_i1.p1 TRINITY_DN5932_c0_g1~~TRINITY_DN5932_c0_g1_i1.p1  ORF type:complete len:212 (+),score=31.40 TRINITY_DN5932_c0_g1_i1:3-638(+)
MCIRDRYQRRVRGSILRNGNSCGVSRRNIFWFKPDTRTHSRLLQSKEDQQDMARSTKRRKRRVNVTTACGNCQKFHTSCDNVRPCKKCVQRGKPCSEGIAKKRGRKSAKDLMESILHQHLEVNGIDLDVNNTIDQATEQQIQIEHDQPQQLSEEKKLDELDCHSGSEDNCEEFTSTWVEPELKYELFTDPLFDFPNPFGGSESFFDNSILF